MWLDDAVIFGDSNVSLYNPYLPGPHTYVRTGYEKSDGELSVGGGVLQSANANQRRETCSSKANRPYSILERP